ncbi:MAG: pilus assembly protein PilM [Planctomycetes bacterium]|nr:pilus assembly protein PilM [Planctomycetota bacterium]
MWKPRRILSVDLGERYVKVVEAEPGPRGFVVLRARSAPVPEPVWGRPVAERAATLRALLSEGGFLAREAVLALPRHLAFLRQLDLPPGDPQEQAQMVRYQAEKELPLPLDQIRFAYAPLGRSVEGAPTPVLMAGVQRAAVDQYVDAAESAGLRVVAATVSTLGMFHAVAFAPAGSLPSAIAGNGTICVDIGAMMTEIAIVAGGRLVFTRSASIGTATRPSAPAETPAPAGDWLNDLAGEIQRTLRAYAAQPGSVAVTGLVCAGGGAVVPDLVPTLSARTGVPSALLRPWAAWPGGALSDSEAAAFATSFGIAGAFCTPEALRLDLLTDPFPAPPRWQWKTMSRPLAAAAAAVFLLIAGGIALAARDRELENLRSQIASEKPKVDEIRALSEKWSLAREWSDRRLSWIEVMREMTEIFPDDVYVTTLNFDDKGQMTLVGRSKSDQLVGTLVTALNKSTYFEEARYLGIKQNSSKDGFGFDFTIQARLTAAAVAR